MKPFTTMALMAVLAVGSYFGYRIWQASAVPPSINIASVESFKDIPPTLCTLSDDGNKISAKLYVSNEFVRFDIAPEIDPLTPIHVIVNDEGFTFVWKEGSRDGIKGDYDAVSRSIQLNTLTKSICKPWWLPAGDMLIPPDSVKFQEYRG